MWQTDVHCQVHNSYSTVGLSDQDQHSGTVQIVSLTTPGTAEIMGNVETPVLTSNTVSLWDQTD